MAYLRANEPPTLPFGDYLDKFPYDVKALIYKCVFQDSPDGKTPALLVALRSHQEKYKDALRIYYQVTMVNLGRGKNRDSKKNGYSIGELKIPALLLVTRLEVSLRGNELTLHPNIEANLQKKIRTMVYLRELVLDFSLVKQNCQPNYARVVEQWLRHFTQLRRITIKPNFSVIAAPRVIPADGLEVPRPGPRVIEALNRALSVPGRLANVTGLNDSCTKTPWCEPGFPENKGFLLFRVYRSWLRNRSVIFHDIWFWEAEKGKTLAWTAPVQVGQPN